MTKAPSITTKGAASASPTSPLTKSIEEKKAAKREYERRYHAKNPEVHRKAMRKWRGKNPDYQRKYYEKNRETFREYYRKKCAAKKAEKNEATE